MDLNEFSKNYLDIINSDFSGLNLTRIVDFDEFYNKQVLDSVEPFNESSVFQNFKKTKTNFIDLGFGGGFPLLPLALSFPELNFFGVEARKKKAEAVQKIAHKLNLSNVKTHHSRLENLDFDSECGLIMKAVGTVEKMLTMVNRPENVTAFILKGPSFWEIESEGVEKIKDTWKLVEEKNIKIPGTEGRKLLVFKGSINNKLLKISKNQNNLVKVSQFF